MITQDLSMLFSPTRAVPPSQLPLLILLSSPVRAASAKWIPTNPSKGLAGAVIKIEGVDNSFTGTYTTGVGGYLQDVPWDTMPIGSYVATEVTPPNGYTISKDPDKVPAGVLLGRQERC